MTTLKSKIGQVVIPLLPMNRRTFDILRYELRAWQTRLFNTLNPARHAQLASLRRQHDLQLNLGSGGKGKPGWINIELIRQCDTVLTLDLRRPLPLADGSAARIFCEHVVEHVDFRQDLPKMLADWNRVLKTGGVARVIVPDMPRHMQAYLSGDPEQWRALGWDIEAMPGDIYTPMHIVNHAFHQEGEHLFGYDFETLKWLFERAGFSRVSRAEFGQSLDPELAIDDPDHARYSLYVEAVK